jgi:uncharacterized protein YaaQ
MESEEPMETELLMLAIIQSQDAESATRALTQAGLRVTRVGSVGGFLRTANVTLLLGLKRDEMPRAIQLLTEHCHERTTFVNAAAEVASWHGGYIAPIEITVGGAAVFALPVERFARFGPQRERAVSAAQEAGMKLVVAIVSQEYSDFVLDALTRAEYRATRISTSGGFWRKGNATLLIGVEASLVDDVLERIEDACASIAEHTKPPTSWATVFVLNAEHYKRV